MPLTFKQFYSYLIGNFPKSNPFLVKQWTQQAWEDIRDSHLWSFLAAEGVLFSPGIITTGTVAVTQFSNTVTFDAAARAALQVTNPDVTKRQLRIGSGGYLYNFASSVNPGTGVATLDRFYKETSNSSAGYQVYRCYYGPPEIGDGTETTDFIRYNSIYNPTISDYFRGIQTPRELLNKIDPQRNNIGNNPYYLFTYKANSSGVPQFEMWPHPTASQAYMANYQRKGIDFATDNEVLPTIIPDQLLLEGAMIYGCEWAYKNMSRYPELRGINWLLMKKEHEKAFSNLDQRNPGLLEEAIRQDQESFPQDIIVDDRTFTNFAIGDDDRTGFFNIKYQ